MCVLIRTFWSWWVTRFISNPKVSMFDAPTFHSGSDLMALAFHTSTAHALFISWARDVDNLNHSLVGTQAWEAGARMSMLQLVHRPVAWILGSDDACISFFG
jgi:hypothetical protein